MFRTTISLLLVGLSHLLLLSDVYAEDKEVIRVGGYDFPPYVTVDSKLNIDGMLPDLLELLNQMQKKYVFKPVGIAAKRRYQDFTDGRYDAIFFEMAEWGWNGIEFEQSKIYLEDTEVYVASSQNGLGKTIFDNLKARRLVGILGYHHGFADFNADESFLSQHFDILLSTSYKQNIELILLNRSDIAEIAIVPMSFLNLYFENHPEAKDKIVISDTPDQIYRLRTLIRPGSSLRAEELNSWLSILESDGTLRKLWQNYGADADNR